MDQSSLVEFMKSIRSNQFVDATDPNGDWRHSPSSAASEIGAAATTGHLFVLGADAFKRLFQDWLHGFPGLFADTPEHIRFFLLFSFLLFDFFSCWFRVVD